MTFEPKEVALALSNPELMLIAKIKRNWVYRNCEEGRQCIRWCIWDLRQVRKQA